MSTFSFSLTVLFLHLLSLPHQIYMQHRDPTKGRFDYTDPDLESDDADDDWGQDENDFDPAHEPPPEQSEDEGRRDSDGEETESESDIDPLGDFTDGLDTTFDDIESGDLEGEDEEEEDDEGDSGENDEDRWINLERYLRAKDQEEDEGNDMELIEDEGVEAESTEAERVAAGANYDDLAMEDVSWNTHFTDKSCLIANFYSLHFPCRVTNRNRRYFRTFKAAAPIENVMQN